jgi:hypothetical protein
MRLVDLAPLHIEDFLQAKFRKGLGHKTVRNVLVLYRESWRWPSTTI